MDDFSYSWHGWIEAWQIFAKYSDKRLGCVGAEHDVIYVWPDKKISKDDANRLKELDWTYDKDLPAWVHDI